MATATRTPLAKYKMRMTSPTDKAWAEKAYRLLERLAKTNQAVHVNDIWAYADKHNWSMPQNRKILGIVFTTAADNGIIAVTDVAIKVTYNGAHYWRPIWRSLVYKKG